MYARIALLINFVDRKKEEGRGIRKTKVGGGAGRVNPPSIVDIEKT